MFKKTTFASSTTKIILNGLCALLMSLIFWMEGCKNKQEVTQPVVKQEEPKVDSAQANKKNIVFFGNSLTAGYGVEQAEAFPALVQAKIDSLNLPYKVINAGLSGETTAGGNTRIDWLLNQPLDIFILELGGNDGLRGIPVSETIKNLQSIIDKVKAKYPSATIILAGIQVPPNMGSKYSTEFKSVFPQLAEKNKVELIPFVLEGVGGVPELNQGDGIHPTEAGHKIVAETVWKVLQNDLK
jgi:acyl-CoA thioesterase-1